MIYKLVSENLTEVGGRMGTERTSVNWQRYFKDKKQAFDVATEDYGKGIITWKKKGGVYSSPDLGYVQYHIVPIEVE